MKDINRLLDASDKKTFEAEATNWPGVETFRKCAWKCQCHRPDCFRNCMQSYAAEFPHREVFAQYLEEIVGIETDEDLQDYTDSFGERIQNRKKLH